MCQANGGLMQMKKANIPAEVCYKKKNNGQYQKERKKKKKQCAAKKNY